MADIKGLVRGEDNIDLLSTDAADETIDCRIVVNGDLYVEGNTFDANISTYNAESDVPAVVIENDLHVTGNILSTDYESPKYKIVDFTTGTDEEIAAMLNAHYHGDIDIANYWHVGDTRKIHLNGIASPNKNGYTSAGAAQDITVVITALNHHDLKEDIGVRSKAAVTIQTREVLNNITSDYNTDGCVFVNFSNDSDTTFYTGAKLPLRTGLNSSFLTTCFSTEWKNIIKETRHKRVTWYVGESVEEVIDKIFLPSFSEVIGTSNNREGVQGDYYKIESNQDKYGNNNGIPNTARAAYWFLGTPGSLSSSNDYEGKVYVGWSHTSAEADGNTAACLAPVGCI